MNPSGLSRFSYAGVWPNRIAAALMPLCMAVLWPLMRPYAGLDRDGQLYAVQAMAHAHPGRYTNDLFFLFGSQDSFTILTRLVSPLYGWLGLDHASALLTVAGALLWWSACLLLTRAVAGPRMAWISLGLIMAAAGWYGGSGEVFRYAETYFGARLPAEALVLLALALQHVGRSLAGCAALAVAFVVHPLMTLPGVAVFALLQLPPKRWPWLVLLASVLVALTIAAAQLAPIGRLRPIDTEWLNILRSRSPFLFPFSWSNLDWQRAIAVHCLLLACSQLVQSTQVKRLAAAAALVGASGVLVAAITSEFAPVQLLLQAQPWRTLWLASVLAYLLVPLAVVDGWRSDAYARASAILLIASACALTPATLLTASIASLVLSLLPNRDRIPHGRLVLMGSIAATSLTILFSLLSALTVTQIPTWGGEDGATLELLRNVFGLVVPGLVVVLVFVLILGANATWIRVCAALLILSPLASLTLRGIVKELAARPYTGESYSLFADWRTQIPPGTNVLWPESPVYAWFLLDRPSYISVSQLAGVIFSRDLAIEGLDRIHSIAGFASEDHLLGRPGAPAKPGALLTLPLLSRVCQDERIGFVVAPTRVLSDAPSKPWPDKTRPIYLYDCRKLRGKGRSLRSA